MCMKTINKLFRNLKNKLKPYITNNETKYEICKYITLEVDRGWFLLNKKYWGST